MRVPGRSAGSAFAILVMLGAIAAVSNPTIRAAASPSHLPPVVQAPGQLVPLITDQVPLALSNVLGAPATGTLNQAGDFLFLGAGQSSLFLKRAGGSITRVWQAGSEVPGIPGSRSDLVHSQLINASGLVAFRFETAMPSGEIQGTVMTWDGTSYRLIASGAALAPGGGGARYERSLGLSSLNDSGDVLFGASLVNALAAVPGPSQSTTYLVPAGQAPQRLFGIGDVAPGTGGGTFASAGGSMNNARDVVVSAQITGGSGGQGIFVFSPSGSRKVAATGDSRPEGGNFVAPASARINNAGQVLFVDNGSVYLDAPGNGLSVVLGAGSALPAVPAGTTSTTANPTVQAFGDTGYAAVIQAIVGSATTNQALIRLLPGSPLEVVAYRNQAAPDGPETFSGFSGVSMNASGLVSFVGAAASVGTIGVFQQAPGGAITTLARDGQATGSTLGGNYELTANLTRTLDDGSTFFPSNLVNASADHAAFLWNGGTPSVLMSTADTQPVGANTFFRALFMEGAGDYVGFPAAKTGGRQSIGVHDTDTRESRIVATDGDPSPLAGGGVLRIAQGGGSVFVNPSGTVAFSTTLVGGTNPGAAIFASPQGGGLIKVAVAGGQDSVGRTLTSVSLAAPSGRSPINVNGHVALRANITGISGGGLFRWAGSGLPVKVAMNGDGTSDPQNLLSPGSPTMNDIGEMAFIATTQGGFAGIFRSGSPHLRIARTGETAPGGLGGTFASFRQPMINNAGEIVFMATLSGGPGSGIFLYTPGTGLSALALNGAPATGGGFFSITTVAASQRADFAINDQGDIAFLSDLTGTPATAAIFIRRGPGGSVTSLVRQGDSAPGTSSTFETLPHTLNNIPGEFLQLSDLGDISFFARVIEAGILVSGTWHVRTDGSIEEVVVRGTISPDFGGGVAVIQSSKPAWISGNRLALRVSVGGGTFGDSIMLFVPPDETTTPEGTNVEVVPVDPVTGTAPASVEFSDVTEAGETTLFTSPAAPTLEGAFALGDPPVYFQISTTAVVSGPITVCISLNGLSFPPGSELRLLHFEDGVWVDITSGTGAGALCGVADGLSPFAVVRLLDETPPTLSVTVDPEVVFPPNGQMVDVTASIVVSDDVDPSPAIELVSITCNEPLAAGDIEGAAFGTDDRSFSLKARRLGGGAGRIYTITYRATDTAGRSTTASAVVLVPHNR